MSIPYLLIGNKFDDDIGTHFDSYYEALVKGDERFIKKFTNAYENKQG